MGSSKKKKDRDREKEHKEHKRKKRHRSRSRSRDRHEHKHDKKRKDDKKRKRDYEHEHEFSVPAESEQVSNVPSTSSNDFPDTEVDGGGKLSLSIEATNKIRAKLGLKPLEQPGSSNKDGDASKSSQKEDVHAPPTNMAQVKKTEDLRRKMMEMKEKRRINMMLGKVKTLADDSDDEGALGWVRRSRKQQEEKQKAAKQAKMLEEMDAQFGIGDLVEEEFNTKKKYTSKHLTGLKVQHDQERFAEGTTVILTLQDQGVLDEEGDTLVNVNLQDDERADKYKDNKKKKPDYNPYDDEYDEYGMVKPKDILDKYDEEIEGKKMESFQLGRGGKYNAEKERRMEQMKRDIQAQGESLTLPTPMTAAEFYTDTEMQSFNKVKKKVRKIRKKQKAITADDILPLPGDNEPLPDFGARKRKKPRDEPEQEEGEISDAEAKEDIMIKLEAIPGLDLVEIELDKSDPYEDEMLGPYEDLEGVALEEDKARLELDLALRKTRKLKFKQDTKDRDKRLAETMMKQEADEEMSNDEPEQPSGTIVLNVMSEFCRSLGEIPTYGMAGNRVEEEDELVDFEQELVDERRMELGDEHKPGWQQVVEIDTKPVQIKEEPEKAVLDDEPVLNEGLAAALELADIKGYLEKQSKKSVSAPKHEILTAKNYSIEDKRYEDLDEKFRKRDRFSGGMVSDFKEKSTYKPNVKLEYVDEGGRFMNQKEAFRYLSHRFHGKGSGKKKTEKRLKKQEEIQLMKTMSSTDTPLGTVALLQEKQKVEKTHYVVLSGGGKATTTLSK